MNLRMKASRLGGTDLLAVSGSLDFSNAEAFRDGLLARIQAEDAHRLIVDFSGVEYISSAGLRVLMIAAREARARGVTLALAALRPVVAEILQISRFDTIFACHASVQDAVDAAFDPVDPARASAMQAPRQGDAITVRFWGTRGSLPAPLGIREFRHKLASALVAGAGAGLDSMDKARVFVETLPFRSGGTYGGNSSCVELDTGGDRFVLLDMGSGARARPHVEQHEPVATGIEFHAGRIAAVGAAAAERQRLNEDARLVHAVEPGAGAGHQRRGQLVAELADAQRRRQRAARAPEAHGDRVALSRRLHRARARRVDRIERRIHRVLHAGVAGKDRVEAADLQDLGHHRPQRRQRQRHPTCARLARGDHQHPQAGAGDVFHAAEIHDQPVCVLGLDARQQAVAKGLGIGEVQRARHRQQVGAAES